jgi:hypothetical protein
LEAAKTMSQQPEGMVKHNPELKKKKVSSRIIIYTKYYIIEANAHGFPSMRLTDLLNGSDLFIPLTDAILYDIHSKEEIARTPFVSINKTVINVVLEKQDKSPHFFQA